MPFSFLSLFLTIFILLPSSTRVNLFFCSLLFVCVIMVAANWCVCKDGVGDPVLQKALDYACGAGADCNPIHSNGPCYNPNTVKAHCSYAVNSYFQRKGQAQGSCDFSGSATVATTDPSSLSFQPLTFTYHFSYFT